jgi:hypothetical protein
MSKLSGQLLRAWKRRGLWGTLSHGSQQAWRRAFAHRQLVYELARDSTATSPAELPAGARITRYRSIGELPKSMLSSLAADHGESFIENARTTLEGGAILYILEMDDRPASFLWARSGALIPRWYVPLSAADMVLYGWFTLPEFRGTGLIRHAIARSMQDAPSEVRRFLADVRVWNKPSIRAMERVGFRYVTSAKPLR